jgi:hypothetical protein
MDGRAIFMPELKTAASRYIRKCCGSCTGDMIVEPTNTVIPSVQINPMYVFASTDIALTPAAPENQNTTLYFFSALPLIL